MKKVVLKLEFYDDKIKQKAMQKVSGLSGVESIAIDTKDKKLTVTGDIDPVKIAGRLRKICHTDIVSVGPAKEPEKKKEEQPKKDEPKKDKEKEEPKKGGGGGDDKKKAAKDKGKEKEDYSPQLLKAFSAPYPQYPPPIPYHHYHQYPPQAPAPAYYVRSVEEDPNSCVIC